MDDLILDIQQENDVIVCFLTFCFHFTINLVTNLLILVQVHYSSQANKEGSPNQLQIPTSIFSTYHPPTPIFCRIRSAVRIGLARYGVFTGVFLVSLMISRVLSIAFSRRQRKLLKLYDYIISQLQQQQIRANSDAEGLVMRGIRVLQLKRQLIGKQVNLNTWNRLVNMVENSDAVKVIHVEFYGEILQIWEYVY